MTGLFGKVARRAVTWGRMARSLRPAPRRPGLSVAMILAYDWALGMQALERFYAIADEVVIGLDEARISYSGKPYPFNEAAFRRALKRLDPQRKVKVLEGPFHSFAHPRDNETHERNAVSMACKPGNWVVQIDADEWMMNPGPFRQWLLSQPIEREVLAHWLTVYKVIGRTALVIEPDDEWQCVATSRRGAYWRTRETGGWRLRSPLKLLHFSWGRSEADLRRKLQNFSHAHDFDTAAFLRQWKGVTLKNHRQWRDFHPLEPKAWGGLRAVPLDQIWDGAEGGN